MTGSNGRRRVVDGGNQPGFANQRHHIRDSARVPWSCPCGSRRWHGSDRAPDGRGQRRTDATAPRNRCSSARAASAASARFRRCSWFATHRADGGFQRRPGRAIQLADQLLEIDVNHRFAHSIHHGGEHLTRRIRSVTWQPLTGEHRVLEIARRPLTEHPRIPPESHPVQLTRWNFVL